MARALTSTEDTAAAAGVHPETLRRLYRAGTIPGYLFGRVLRFDLDEICAVLRSNQTGTPASGRVAPDFGALEP